MLCRKIIARSVFYIYLFPSMTCLRTLIQHTIHTADADHASGPRTHTHTCSHTHAQSIAVLPHLWYGPCCEQKALRTYTTCQRLNAPTQLCFPTRVFVSRSMDNAGPIDSTEHTDQTPRTHMLIWAFADRTCPKVQVRFLATWRNYKTPG